MSEDERKMRNLLELGRQFWGDTAKVRKFQELLSRDHEGEYLVSGGSWTSSNYGENRYQEGESLKIAQSFPLSRKLIDKPHYTQVEYQTRRVTSYGDQKVEEQTFG
jgi:hypothetical protein